MKQQFEMEDPCLYITVEETGEVSVDYCNGKEASQHHYEVACEWLTDKGIKFND